MADPAAVSTVRETELKLTVPDGADVAGMLGPGGPIAAVGEPTTATLRTTYYDTADLRLAREGITLRRRLGDDEGWHLKLPAQGGRDEVRTDVSGATPPETLRSLVRVYTRGERIRRVTTLETVRTTRRLLGPGGDLLGVVVDDLVRVLDGRHELSRFREVEVEASPDIEDPTPLLDDVAGRLTAAGATLGEQTPKAVRALGAAATQPPAPPPPGKVGRKASMGDILTAAVRRHTRALMLADVGVRRSLPGAAEQFRRTALRLAGTLRVFAPLLPAGEELAEEVTGVAAVLGGMRDSEALLRRLPRDVGAVPLPAADSATLTSYVETRLRAELASGATAGLELLDSRRYARLVGRLVDTATEPDLAPAGSERASDALPALIARLAAGLADLPHGLDAPDGDERYAASVIATADAAEFAVPYTARPDLARRYAKRVGALRDALQAHRDAAEAVAATRRLGTAAKPQVAFGLGMLALYEAQAAEAAAAEVAAAWRSYDRPSTPRGLVSPP